MATVEIYTERPWVREHDGHEYAPVDTLVATVTTGVGESFGVEEKQLIVGGWTSLQGTSVVLSVPRPEINTLTNIKTVLPAGTQLFTLVVEPAFASILNESGVVSGLSVFPFLFREVHV